MQIFLKLLNIQAGVWMKCVCQKLKIFNKISEKPYRKMYHWLILLILLNLNHYICLNYSVYLTYCITIK